MKKLSFSIVLLILCFGVYSQKSYKRGVAYGYHSTQDMQKASENISWWYNWATQPDVNIRNSYNVYNVDFTPMSWNSSGTTGVNTWVEKDSTVKYILGFNEPNFKSQANMTPTQAAKAWPALQKIAQKNNLKIVSPAVNYCSTDGSVFENGKYYTNPFTYLDDFFTACDTCQVDYIGLHWYGSGNSIVNYVNTARKYNKPIWVTEFASWDYSNLVQNVDDQIKYLAGTTNFLERDPDVYRYSWFIGRTQGGITASPYIDLYGKNGMLTELGQMYMDIPVYDPEKKFDIPGRIECEEYYLMSGLFCEPTNDENGFLNVGWTDMGDWADYKILVEKSGTYSMNLRTSGTGSGKIDILIDNELIKTIDTPSTGDWQIWKDVLTSIDLEAGEHLLRWRVRRAGFNINWIEISNSTSANEFEIIETSVYPNPVNDGIINVKLNRDKWGGEYKCDVFDINGNQVFTKNININRSLFQLNINEKHRLPAGVYYLKISGENCSANKLIVVQ